MLRVGVPLTLHEATTLVRQVGADQLGVVSEQLLHSIHAYFSTLGAAALNGPQGQAGDGEAYESVPGLGSFLRPDQLPPNYGGGSLVAATAAAAAPKFDRNEVPRRLAAEGEHELGGPPTGVCVCVCMNKCMCIRI